MVSLALPRLIGRKDGGSQEAVTAESAVGAAAEYLPQRVLSPGDFVGTEHEVHAVLTASRRGVAYVAYSHRDNAAVVLRTLGPTTLGEAVLRTAFRERALSWLELTGHAAIQSGLEVIEIGGRPYLVTEYLPTDEFGTTVADRVRHKQVDRHRALVWADALATALDAVHRAGLRSWRPLGLDDLFVTSDRGLKLSPGPFVPSDPAVLESRTARGPFRKFLSRGTDEDLQLFALLFLQMLGGVLDGRTSAILSRCAGEHASNRYRDFTALAKDLRAAVEADAGAHLDYWTDEQHARHDVVRRALGLATVDRAMEGWTLLDQLLEESPAFALGWVARARVNRMLGNTAEALADAQRATQLNAQMATAWLEHGMALRSAGRPAEARSSYERSLRLAPGSAPGWNGLGACHLDLGEPEAALECFERAAECLPGYAASWRNIGTALQRLGQPDLAVAAFKQAADMAPSDPWVLRACAQALRDVGRDDEASLYAAAERGLDPAAPVFAA